MSLESSKPVTHWLAMLQNGDEKAAQHLWEEYYLRLVRIAQQRLRATGVDDEVVAASAFNSFCLAAMNGQFPLLADRHNLWHLLISITARKAVSHLRRENAEKRGGKAEFVDADFESIVSREPTPEFATMMIDAFNHLLDRLPNDNLRKIALWKMEGLSHQQIAEKLDCSLRNIGIKLDLIRGLLKDESPP